MYVNRVYFLSKRIVVHASVNISSGLDISTGIAKIGGGVETIFFLNGKRDNLILSMTLHIFMN